MGGKDSAYSNGAKRELAKTPKVATTVAHPTPPDGGWGWVVVVASFFSNLIVDGVLYTFGILYVELQIAFPEASKGKIALIGSLLGGMYLIGGPIVSALANKFGCRAVAIAGSLVTATAFIVSIFSTSVNMLLATYGAIGGLGFGMMYLPSIVMVGLYFDKRRAMATGIAVCGSGIGTFVFAPLARFLNDNYGWRGSVLILAGIMLNGIACGAVYLPLKAHVTKDADSEAPPHQTTTTLPLKHHHPVEDDEKKGASDLGVEGMEPLRPFHRLDVFYTGSVTNLNEYKASPDMAAYISSVTSIPRPEEESALTPLVSVLRTMFDFSLFLSPTFLVICLSGILGFMGFFTPFVYLTDYSRKQGVDASQASLLLSIVGITSTVSRLVTGWLADRPWADSLIIHNIAIILAGCSTCLLPLLHNASLLFLYAVVFGITLAAFISLRSIVLCDLLGVQKLTNAFGLLVLFQGLALLTGTYLSGAIYESTDSYAIPFIVVGILMIMAGVVPVPLRRIARWEDGRNAKKTKGETPKDYTNIKRTETNA